LSPSLLRVDDCKDWLESRHVQAFFLGLLWLYVAIQIIYAVVVPVSKFDDSMPLVYADLINHGRVPQVDFSDFYPPLEQYSTALLLRFFGRTVLVHRFLCAALFIVVVISANRFFKVHAARCRPLVPLMTMLLAVGIGWGIQLPPWPGYALAFLALLAYFMNQERSSTGNRWNTILAGLLAGVAALIRLNFGIYAAGVVFLDLLVWNLDRENLRAKRWLLSYAEFVIPLLLLNAIFYLCIYGAQALKPFVETLASSRSSGELRFVDLHWSWQLSAVIWPFSWFSLKMIVTEDRLSLRSLIPVIPAVIVVALVFGERGNPSIALWLPALGILAVSLLQMFVFPLERAEFGFVLYLVCLLHYYLYRVDEFHAWPVIPIVTMFIPYLIITPVQGRSAPLGRGIAFFLLVASMVVISTKSNTPHTDQLKNGAILIKQALNFRRISDSDRFMTNDPGSPWLFIYPHEPIEYDSLWPDEFQAVRFIRSNTGPADPIFVGLKDHSKVFMNDVRFYWLSERLPGSRYINLEPWSIQTESAQREIVSDLQRSGTNWAILEDPEYLVVESSIQRSHPRGSRLLNDFFLANFQEIAAFGRLSVIRRQHHENGQKQ
jgi:hypothetical protein